VADIVPRTVGLTVYAVAVTALGALVVSGQFVYVWAPIPDWAMLVVASAIAGAAWIVADSYADRSLRPNSP